MIPNGVREYFCIGGEYATGDALKLPVGSWLGAQYYDAGMKFVPMQITGYTAQQVELDKETKEEVVTQPAALQVKLYPYGDGEPKNLRLVHTENRLGVHGFQRVLSLDPGRKQEYLLLKLSSQELHSVVDHVADTEGECEIVMQLSPREIAGKLLGVMSKETARGSHKLAEMAGMEYSDLILTILKKLKDANRVKLVRVEGKGKWMLA